MQYEMGKKDSWTGMAQRTEYIAAGWLAITFTSSTRLNFQARWIAKAEIFYGVVWTVAQYGYNKKQTNKIKKKQNVDYYFGSILLKKKKQNNKQQESESVSKHKLLLHRANNLMYSLT